MICGNYLWLAAPFSLTRQTLTNHSVGSKLLPPTITVIVWGREKKKTILLLSWFFYFFISACKVGYDSTSSCLWGKQKQSLWYRQWVKVEQHTMKAALMLSCFVHPVARVRPSSWLEVVHYRSSTFAFRLNCFISMPVLSSHGVRRGCAGCFLQQLQWCDGTVGMIHLKGTSHTSCLSCLLVF